MTKPTPTNGPVSIREVYQLLQDIRAEIKQRDDTTWTRIMQMKKDADIVHAEHDRNIDAIMKEIYGAGDSKGLRGRTLDLESSFKIAHIVQGTFTSVVAAITGIWASNK